MVDLVDERRRRGAPPGQAIIDRAKARFRPILLTSLTTCLGFASILFERSEQGQRHRARGRLDGLRHLLATAALTLMVPALTAVATGADRHGEDPAAPEGAET